MSGREKQPGPGWDPERWPGPRPATASAWRCGPIFVLSEFAVAESPDGNGVGPQWLISISESGRRPKPKQVRKALRAFGMVGAEEDQHYPGVARHFWQPIDAAHRAQCQCKASERVVVEADGYTWTTPVDGECRGCELEQTTGAACPVHRPEAQGNRRGIARSLGELR